MSLKDIVHIMVVDDHITSRMMTVESLQEMGVKNIQIAKDGREAFTKLSTQPVHLVISDVFMPDVDGLSLLKAVRGHPKLSKMGFILLTGKRDYEVITKAQALGANNVLAKPIDKPGLRRAIEGVIGRL
ncbi:MAG: response regulator [Zhengella sp.]|uniref:response regulator n=1 Tax=Zhengella sp. TaxID=2282762 RepID=UPI001D5FDEA2|nr:response regulator [Notoacmeibacter sp.]MCC0027751.1 response regulator [Brucellaceae bacterium]